MANQDGETLIRRDTDDQDPEECEGVHDIIKRLNYRDYVGTNGKFKNSLYKKLSGEFAFKNLPGPDKQGIITLVMDNAQTELIVGLLLLSTDNKHTKRIMKMIDTSKLRQFRQLAEYTNNKVVFTPAFCKVYMDTIKYLEVKKDGRGKVISPITERPIKKSGATYRQMFGKIKLKAVINKDISKYLTTEYKITGNCVESYLRKFIDKEIDFDVVLQVDPDHSTGFTYLQLFEVCGFYCVDCYVRDVDYSMIDEYHCSVEGCKTLNIMIHDEHMYVLSRQQEKQEVRKHILITSREEIEVYKYSKLIITDWELFKAIKNEIREKYSALDYSQDCIHFKTNSIYCYPDYINDNETLGKSTCLSVYSLMESQFRLKGFMSADVYSAFENVNKIRLFEGTGETTIKLDENKAYPAQTYKQGLLYPVPSFIDDFKKYSGEVRAHGVYYCTITEHDRILAPYDGYYTGYEVQILKKEKRIKKITSQYVTDKFKTLNVRDCKKYSYGQMRQYIGWLQKSITTKTQIYDDIKGNEAEAMLLKYGDEAHASNDINTGKDILRVHKEYLTVKTGILANIFVKAHTNIDLYNLNKEFMKLNKSAILNTIRTDCLGYQAENYKLPTDLVTNDKTPGKFKVEAIKDARNPYEQQAIPDIDHKITEKLKVDKRDINEIPDMLDNREGFQIVGGPGMGKTWTLENTIIPYLDSKGMKYIIASPTIENAKDIKGVTIQSLFSKKSVHEIKQLFSGISYLILDESSQLDQSLFKRIEFVIRNTDCSLILSGDPFQCKAIDAQEKPWITTDFVHGLCDRNVVEMKYTKNCRYTKEVHKLLTFVKTNFDDIHKIYTNIKKNYKKRFVKKSSTDLNLAYYNKTCATVKKLDKECHTVHTYQGKTIAEDYTIFDMAKMPSDVLYTSLSRAKTLEQIFICEN